MKKILLGCFVMAALSFFTVFQVGCQKSIGNVSKADTTNTSQTDTSFIIEYHGITYSWKGSGRRDVNAPSQPFEVYAASDTVGPTGPSNCNFAFTTVDTTLLSGRYAIDTSLVTFNNYLNGGKQAFFNGKTGWINISKTGGYYISGTFILYSSVNTLDSVTGTFINLYMAP